MTQLSFPLTKENTYNGIAPHIVDAFIAYNNENPGVYKMFKHYANQLMSQGINHYGSKAIMERIRWHYEVEKRSGDFKLNNNYASCFARLLMSEDPSFKTFFEIRTNKQAA